MLGQIWNSSPVVVGIIVFVLGVGGGAVMLTPPDYMIARASWTVAALIALIYLAYIVITAQSSTVERIAFSILTFGMLGGAWAWSMLWIEERAKLTSPRPTATRTEVLQTTPASGNPSLLPQAEHDPVSRNEALLADVPDPEYRRLVASIIHAVEPKSSVSVGTLLNTPDGTRTIDVSVRSSDDARLTAIDILNLPDGKKADVEFVDAAESKRKDIKVDFIILCSNTGFDEIAIRKAKRAKIGLISVLRHGDKRVKAVVEEVMYLRKVDLNPMTIHYTGETERLPSDVKLHDLKYNGESLDAWLIFQAMQAVFVNPTVACKLTASFHLKTPTEFELGQHRIMLRSFAIQFQPKVKWFSQVVKIDATTGIHDYVRGKTRLGGGHGSYIVQGIDFEKATLLSSPPDTADLADLGKTLNDNEIEMRLVMFENLPDGLASHSPGVTSLVRPEDLTLRINDKCVN